MLLFHTSHDIEVVDVVPVVSILCVDVALQIVLVRLACAIVAVVVVTIRIRRNESFLTTFGIVTTHVSMDVKVFETMNLIVELDVTNHHIGFCLVVLIVDESNRVLRCVGVGRVFPILIVEICCQWILPIATKFNETWIATCQTYRMSWVSTNGIAKCTAIRIFVLRMHILCCEVHCQVVVEEGRSEVQRGSEALEFGVLHNTVLVGIADTHTVRQCLHSTCYTHLMVGTHCSAVDFILPVSVSCTQRGTVLAKCLSNVFAILVA